ncbi:MarR family winged helix-turn-helix transcriptional regulator [Corynebacterium ammoniagenes]|jgi:DNA-binding MarR family transcriptional regulator|uniref:Transcriptional regulator n=2 Tax=Corynebacterium ammoniagenes TaxID=1697 RepID=A0AAV5G832_CORAM|nr:MarR family winged helix-turn-helix transcriptional regulator [Corynebacterium ammoniagenes]APT82924.1 MarR family transcriptional regulator [Corynebacterium ammoniagenes DSM 20306]AQS73971.1 MarR family transcriptional regulator [Corynebacterium ammoniagenes]EFG80641.1 transcriptional regulator, MarR family [Corynebacterium ammoniagenes DSM 20306]NMF31450.1 winged helix-turn-helix transcriptional regulator [Corynebacterium ammoniagenes]GJN42818.1 transcriptional regulator [Corynebacterium 
MIEQPRWLNDDEQELWQLILAATRKLDRGMENTLQAGGELSMPEFAVLATLSDAEEQQMRLRELCNFLEWDRSRTSHQVTRMERRGLLTKCKSVGDARGVMVQLTEEGSRRLAASAPDHVESVRRLVFDHLKPEDIPSLQRFLQGILDVDNVPGYGEY